MGNRVIADLEYIGFYVLDDGEKVLPVVVTDSDCYARFYGCEVLADGFVSGGRRYGSMREFFGDTDEYRCFRQRVLAQGVRVGVTN